MPFLRTERREDGVAIVTMDAPDKPVNTLSRELMEEMERDFLPLLDDPRVRAVVLASAKESFIAGADLNMLDEVQSVEEGEELSRAANEFLNRIASSPKPVVAAVHGAALGGGLEVALACHLIVASNHPSTVLALPEVQLGLLPAAGGTQRLPKRVGLPQALGMMLTGRRIRAKRAYRMGLVDVLTTPGGIADTAARAAVLHLEGKLERRRRKKRLWERLLIFPPVRSLIISRARTQVLKQTQGNYPAPLAILKTVGVGQWHGMAAGLKEEAANFGRLIPGTESRNLVRLFHAMTDLKKLPEKAKPRPVKRLAVLGAGIMGAGVAQVSLSESAVVLRDISEESIRSAAGTVFDGLVGRVRSGAITRAESHEQWSRLWLTTDVEDLRDADLVVEAVFEDLQLKRKVLAETEERIPEKAVFASNTSALPISEIAKKARHPERVLGMHYFSPVPKMPLLEIIVTDKTASWALDTARAVGVAQGKTVIVVKDGPGFYTTRILAPGLNEALLLLREGAMIENIDRAMLKWGFPVGPVKLIDEIGIDVGAHVSHDLGGMFERRGHGAPSDALSRMFEAGYLGKKNRRGFYRYKGKRKPDPDVYQFFGNGREKDIPVRDIVDRISLMMINEAALCLQEGIVGSARDADIGAIFGLGFPPFRGGPFRHIDEVGAKSVVERLLDLEGKHGPRFRPADILVEHAREGRAFH